MSNKEKQEKQKELLQNYAKRTEFLLQSGLNWLRSIDLDVSSIEKILNESLSIFTKDEIPSKQELIKAVNGLEKETDYVMFLYIDNLEKEIKHPDLLPDISNAQMLWAKQYNKALENRQNRGYAGFDG